MQRQRESVIWERIQTLQTIVDARRAEAAEIFKHAKNAKVTRASDGKLKQLMHEASLSDAELALDVRQTNRRSAEFQDRITKVLRGLGESLLDLRKRTIPDKGVTLQHFEASQLPAAWEKLEKLKSRVNGFSMDDLSRSVNRLKENAKSTFEDVLRMHGDTNRGQEQYQNAWNTFPDAVRDLKGRSSLVSGNSLPPRLFPDDWDSHAQRPESVSGSGMSPRFFSEHWSTHAQRPERDLHEPRAAPVGLVEASEYLAPKRIASPDGEEAYPEFEEGPPSAFDIPYARSDEPQRYQAASYETAVPHGSMRWVEDPDQRAQHHSHYHSMEEPHYHRVHWVQDPPQLRTRGHWEESSFIQAKDAKSRPRSTHHKIDKDYSGALEVSDETQPKK